MKTSCTEALHDRVPEGVPVEAVCLMTDAAGFTRFAEQRSCSEVARFLERYFGIIETPIREAGGMLVDTVGDSLFAAWFATDGVGPACEAAVRACIGVGEAVLGAMPASVLPTRIGVACGPVAVTRFGVEEARVRHLVGDTVNTAQRIQALNKHFGTRVLVSEEVALALPAYPVRLRGACLVPGKHRPLVVYELAADVGFAARPDAGDVRVA